MIFKEINELYPFKVFNENGTNVNHCPFSGYNGEAQSKVLRTVVAHLPPQNKESSRVILFRT